MADLRQGKTANNYHRLLQYAFAYRSFKPRRARTAPDLMRVRVQAGRAAFLQSLRFGAHAEAMRFDDLEGISSLPSTMQRELTYTENIEEVMDSGEFPEEHATIRSSVSVPLEISQRPLLDRLYRRLLARQAAIANQRRFWWEASTLPISSITDILVEVIATHLDDQTSFNSLAVLTHVMLAVFTGQDPETITELQFLRSWTPDKTFDETSPLFYDQDSNCLAYLVDHRTLGYYRGDTPDFSKQCRPTSPWVILALHPIAISVLRRYLRHRANLRSIPAELHDHIFLLTHGEQIERLTSTATNRMLRGPSRPEANSPFTIQRLSRSVLTHLTTQFGLDPILACYVSGMVPFHLRAQMFYTHVSARHCSSTISGAINRLADQIEDEFVDNAYVRPVKEFWRNERRSGWRLSEIPGFWEGTGSRCVLTDEAVKQFFSTYREKLTCLQGQTTRHSPSQKRITYFNLVIIHNYLIYQFSTGIRPLKDPPVTAHTTDEGYSSVILRDKRNIRFPEAREIPHAPIAQQALRLCAEAIDTISSTLAREGLRIDKWWQKKDKPFFFVLSEDGAPHPLSPSTLGYWLAAVDGLAPLYLVPKNAPRHYLRSSLFQEGFSLAFIDRIMGHMHAGHEPTSVLAATDTQQANAQFIAHVTRMTETLGLVPIAYTLRDYRRSA